MRVKLSLLELDNLFGALELHGFTQTKTASLLGLSRRTVADWKCGKCNMTEQGFQQVLSLAEFSSENLNPVFIDEKEQRRIAAKKGGKACFEKYGQLGNLQTRQLGGRSSYEKRKLEPNGIFTQKTICTPALDEKLAEFIGIMIGDGSITSYQASIAFNMTEDKVYIAYVAELIKELFGVTPALQHRPKCNCSVLFVSGIKLVDFLQEAGLPKGDKIRGGLAIPSWVACDEELTKSCLRGIFDTDGCIFIEKHRIKKAIYCYPRMAIVSASASLRESLYISLQGLGFEPHKRQERSVNLERFTDINKYFKIIGSSNLKHLRRFGNIGGVG